MVEHSVAIMSKLKERDENGSYRFCVETRIKITQEQIEELALNDYLGDGTGLNEDRTYYTELEEIKNY